MNARVLSVNVGRPAPLSTGKRVVESAIVKAPVEGPVAVRGVNLAGDDQADRSVHGGPDQAVYAYASEDTAYWAAELGRELPHGTFGENLTLEGIDVSRRPHRRALADRHGRAAHHRPAPPLLQARGAHRRAAAS